MSKADVATLRTSIAALEVGRRQVREVVPFALNEVDGKLPGGGLSLGALHEVGGGGNGAVGRNAGGQGDVASALKGWDDFDLNGLLR